MGFRKFKVVVTDADFPSHEKEREVLKDVAELIEARCKSEEEVVEVAKDADALLVQYAKISSRVISSLKKVKVIVRYGVGYDNIDVEAATERGIYVVNIPDYCTSEVVEHTISLILSLARKIPWADRSVKSGRWSWKEFRPINRLKGKIAGVIGLGRIGGLVAQRLVSLGFKVVGCDPHIPKTVFEKLQAESTGLRSLLGRSDFVTVHVPLTKETYHLIGEDELRLMKRSAFLVNTSRGAVVDEKALYKALSEGWIAAAALDVLELEPPASNNPLLKLDNVILTPHMAWYSEESFLELQEKAAEEARRVLMGEEPINLVNPTVLKRQRLKLG